MANVRRGCKGPIRNLRWWIIGVCFFGTTVNYIDRQCLSVAAPTICKEFDFNNADYASIVSSFMVAYAVMQFLAGAMMDRIGVRWGMAAFAAWWSVAGMLHALCGGLGGFRACRFLLGMGEGGNWPGATKAVAEWFPTRERGLAVAIFDSGSGVGGIVAAPLVAWLIMHYGWRFAFLATGALALVWLVPWLWLYHSPERHPRISQSELELALADRLADGEQDARHEPWLSLLVREVWGIVLGRLLTDCVWWFYAYWLPKYLADQRGFSLGEIAASAWIPFVAVDLGNLTGGWLSGRLMRCGWSLNASRKAVLALGVLGMLAGIPAGLTPHAVLCVLLIAVATFSYAAWGTIMLTLPTDLFAARQTGSVSGLSGTGAGLGGLAFTYVIGAVADRASYTPIFLAAGLMPVAALVIVQGLIPHIAGSPTPGRQRR